MLLLHYCYFSFRNNSGEKHDLRVRVVDLSLEWHLYVNDQEVACFQDEATNVLIEQQLERALSFKNVNKVYSELLKGPPVGYTTPLPEKIAGQPDGSAAFPEWRAELIRVTARATGQSEAVIKINNTEAEKWYRDGFTPFQCFRETYDMENDTF